MITHINKNWSIYAWYLIIVIGLIITIAPFWWALSSSFKDNVTIFAEVAPFSFWSMVPGTSLDPYYGIFQKGFGQAMINTFFVSVVSVIGGIFINSMAGFAFAQFRFKGDNIMFGFILFNQFPDVYTWLGTAIIITGGILLTRSETRTANVKPQKKLVDYL